MPTMESPGTGQVSCVGKKRRVAEAARLVGLVMTLTAIYLWFPVPSARMPDARLSVNSWANQMSAEIGKAACIGFGLGDESSVHVQDATLTIAEALNDAMLPHRITYRSDNIVALALSLSVSMLAFLLFFVRCHGGVWRKIGASLLGLAVFAICFVARGAVFGVMAAHGLEKPLVFLDNPIRLVLLLVQGCVTLRACAAKKKE